MNTASPALRGGALALLAAALFGLSTPLVQRFGQGLGPFSTAALLYAGAALVALFQRRGAGAEAPLRRSDAPRLLAMVAAGAVIGPVALAWGLQRTSGASASLLLTLEAVFTAVLAWRWYGEVLDGRVKTAVALLLAGGALLVIDQGLSGQVQLLGLLAVAVATIAWGVDNTLSRGVAERDPGQVVLVKTALGASVTGALALAWGEPLPTLWAALGLLAVGATGYGLSLRFYLLAQRHFGAARTGSVFAFAPFVGALGAFALGERSGSVFMLLGGLLMAAGIVLHLAENHAHEHRHDALDHEHAHTHDDGHHLHSHSPMPTGPHSHPHHHSPLHHARPTCTMGIRTWKNSVNRPWKRRKGARVRPHPHRDADRSGFAHELRLELHRTDAIDLAVDVVVAIHPADVARFGAHLEHRRRTLEPEVLGQGDGVAVMQHIAHRVFPHPHRFGVSGGGAGAPFVTALGADEQLTVGVGEGGLASRAGREAHEGERERRLKTR